MPITNINSYGSISKFIPAKFIMGNATSVTPLESWMYNDNLGDPWWVGAGGNPCKWVITADITSVSHSSHLTRIPFVYTGMDLVPGMWVASTSSTAALRINSISQMTDNSITFVAEDVDRFNTFNDPTSSGTGAFSTGDIFFFELGDDGLPAFNIIPVAIDPFLLSQIESRFRVFNPSVQVPFYQIDHGFVEGNTLTLDPTTQLFRNATAEDIFRVGTVTATGPGPNYFYLEPLTKIITNLEPGLPGPIGGVVWLDPVTGNMSTSQSSSIDAVYIKMTDATPSFTVSSTIMPGGYNGWQFMLNEVLLTINGTAPDPQPTSYFIDLINSTTSEHGVTAQLGSQPTNVTGSVEFPTGYANPNSPAIVFTLNGVTVTVETPSIMINSFSGTQVGWWDFVRAINEQTQIHGVYASVDPNNGWLILGNASGGPIDIVNVSPATSDTTDGYLTFTAICGLPMSTPAGIADYLSLTRSDGGSIVITDYQVQAGQSTQLGAFVTNAEINSVSNGALPLALVVDQSMYANTNYIVPNIAGRDALTGMRVGDQVYVQADTNGEWSMYLYTASGWVEIANQASASTDANSIQTVITTSSPASQSIGVVSLDSTIISVMVQVTTPFAADSVLTIGTSSVVDAIMPASTIDLTTIGNYEIDPSFVYGSSTSDFNVDVYFTVGSATTGSATVIVSYL
jgi:hypothetical protein